MCGEFPQNVVCQFILHDCAQNLDQIHAHRFVVRGFLVRGFVDEFTLPSASASVVRRGRVAVSAQYVSSRAHEVLEIPFVQRPELRIRRVSQRRIEIDAEHLLPLARSELPSLSASLCTYQDEAWQDRTQRH